MGMFARSVGAGILGFAASLSAAGNARADEPATAAAPTTAPTPIKAPVSSMQEYRSIRGEFKGIEEAFKNVGKLDPVTRSSVLLDLVERSGELNIRLEKLSSSISGTPAEVSVVTNATGMLAPMVKALNEKIVEAGKQNPVAATPAPAAAPAPVAAAPAPAPAPASKATAPVASEDAIAAYRSAKIDGLFIKAEQRVGGIDYLKNVLGEGQAAVDKIMAFQTKREFEEYVRQLESNLNQMQRIPAQKAQAAAPTGAVVNPLADPRAAQAYRFREDNHAIGTAFAGQRFVFNEQNQRERVVRGAINNFRTATDAARNFRRFLDGK